MSEKENDTDWNEFTDGLDESLKSAKVNHELERKKEIDLINRCILASQNEEEERLQNERLQNERIHRERARKILEDMKEEERVKYLLKMEKEEHRTIVKKQRYKQKINSRKIAVIILLILICAPIIGYYGYTKYDNPASWSGNLERGDTKAFWLNNMNSFHEWNITAELTILSPMLSYEHDSFYIIAWDEFRILKSAGLIRSTQTTYIINYIGPRCKFYISNAWNVMEYELKVYSECLF